MRIACESDTANMQERQWNESLSTSVGCMLQLNYSSSLNWWFAKSISLFATFLLLVSISTWSIFSTLPLPLSMRFRLVLVFALTTHCLLSPLPTFFFFSFFVRFALRTHWKASICSDFPLTSHLKYTFRFVWHGICLDREFEVRLIGMDAIGAMKCLDVMMMRRRLVRARNELFQQMRSVRLPNVGLLWHLLIDIHMLKQRCIVKTVPLQLIDRFCRCNKFGC